MNHITSRHNPAIKQLIELKKSDVRKETGLCVVEGIRAITSFLNSPYTLEKLYITEKNYALIQNIVPESKLFCLSDQLMNIVSSASTPSGILAVFKIPQAPSPDLLGSGIVLARIQDPGNMGTIIRTSIACGLPSVVVVEGCDPWSPKVIQASAGALAAAHLFDWSWEHLITHKKNLTLCALVPHGGTSPHDLTHSNILVVVGNEAHGLPAEWQKSCDQLVTLPMSESVESLNAAVAASIALYLITH